MISFFRKTRRSLFLKRQFTKYLFYALGELFLVVLGILIALYINNRNEARKSSQANKQLLTLLKEENRLNIAELEFEEAYRDTISTTLYRFNRFLKQPLVEKQEELKRFIGATTRTSSYSLTNTYIKEYIRFNEGSNTYLAAQLIQLDIDQSFLNNLSTKALDFRLDEYFNYLATAVDFSSLEIRTIEKFQSVEFRNIVLLLASIEDGVLTQYNKALAQQKVVDSLIQIELR
ncbi:MAG: hypothetical protein AAGF77_08490 [Bacteroidota bacterium]